MTEVCGDAACYFEPGDPDGLAAAMAAIAGMAGTAGTAGTAGMAGIAGMADGTAAWKELAERGRRRAVRYSWAASARRHLDAYSLAHRR